MFLQVVDDKVLINQRLVGYIHKGCFFMNCECMVRDPDMWFVLQVQKQLFDRAFKKRQLKSVEIDGTDLMVCINDFNSIDYEIIETDELFDDDFDITDGEIIWSEMSFAENCLIGKNKVVTDECIKTSVGYDYRPGTDIELRYVSGYRDWEDDGDCWWM